MEKSTILLKDFLNGFPDASNPLDDIRFAKYSIACAEEGKSFNGEIIEQKVSKLRYEHLVLGFEWIRTAVDCLKEEGRLK